MTTRLPPGFSLRPPTLDDAPAVAAAIAACQAVDQGQAKVTTAELRSDWVGVDLANEAIVVVAPDGTIAGGADLINRAYQAISVYGFVTPVYRQRGIGGAIVAWGERWAAARLALAPPAARVVVQHYILATQADALALLADAAYLPVRGVFEMTIDLTAPPPRPVWPESVAVRTFVPGQDDRLCHAAVEDAFRDLWGRPPGTFDRFVALTTDAVFDPGLWYLAMAGDEIAGVGLARVVAGTGWIDVVGVRRPWRRRGLGLALLHQMFTGMFERGVRQIGLSVDAESLTGAPRLYHRAGMRVLRNWVIYRKEIRSGVDLTAQLTQTD
jgi:ribosomal protein S18 acetylase RimI-like enzyme